jgi:tetratricopeptide (TPR) repeat protein
LSGFLFNIGQCHRFLGDCKTAIFFYSGFIRANPGTPDAKFVSRLVGRCQARLAGEKVRRSEADQLYAAGRTALTLGQYGEAIRKLTAAYRKLPLPGYLFHLGEASPGHKQYVKAVHFYRQYLRFNPGSPQVKQVRVRIAECKRLHAARIRQNLNLGGATPPGGKPKPVYKRWWFWTTVVVAVVATAVGLGVGLGLPEQQKLPRGTLDSIDWSGLKITGGGR